MTTKDNKPITIQQLLDFLEHGEKTPATSILVRAIIYLSDQVERLQQQVDELQEQVDDLPNIPEVDSTVLRSLLRDEPSSPEPTPPRIFLRPDVYDYLYGELMKSKNFAINEDIYAAFCGSSRDFFTVNGVIFQRAGTKEADK